MVRKRKLEATAEPAQQLPKPDYGESYDDYMERCTGDGNSEEECDLIWEEEAGATPGKGASAGWLQARTQAPPVGVDRSARIIRGYVVAQEGPFKSEGRGAFDQDGLATIVKMAGELPRGLKSRFAHPTMSDDGLGKFLGRAHNLRLDKAIDDRTQRPVKAVRGDLHFDPTASKTPSGDLAAYVMDLAESDPAALSSSLVLEADEEAQLDGKGKPKLDAAGEPLPPLWKPKRLHASDIVDTGDAVDGFLSAPDLAQALSVGLTPELAKLLRFDNVARLATQLLDGMFRGQQREQVEGRCRRWLERYLGLRFPAAAPQATPRLDALSLRLRENQLMLDKRRG